MSHQVIEICFNYEIEQDNDDHLEKVNKAIHTLFGEEAEIDWRDEQTVWIHDPKIVQIDTMITL